MTVFKSRHPCANFALAERLKRHSPGAKFSGFQSTDRKSTRLNSSHGYISYAVFCLKKKKTIPCPTYRCSHICSSSSACTSFNSCCQVSRCSALQIIRENHQTKSAQLRLALYERSSS